MALIVPNTSLTYFLGKILDEGLTLHLYKNEVIIDGSTNAGDFLEADFTGYSSTALASLNWNITTADTSIATYDTEQEFELTATETQEIYGYYITYSGGPQAGAVAWAESFPSAQTMSAIGDKIRITPVITQSRAGV